MIDGAEHTLHLQTYILAEDTTGKKIIEALKRAAQRKVEVFLLLDAYGSRGLSSAFVKTITDAGILFRWFGPVFSFKSFGVGRRLHHKVAVADGRTGIIGGINISDNYNDIGNEPAWLDFAIQMEGSICETLMQHCQKIWARDYKISLPAPKAVNIKRQVSKAKTSNQAIRLLENDWFRGKTEVTEWYRKAFGKAKESVILTGTYFIPGRKLRKNLRKAAERGIDIKIIVGKKTDVWLAKQATFYLYNWMLRNGFKIYEWEPSVLHAKVAVIDKKWSTIGSSNLNELSDYGSIEMNAEISDPLFSAAFHNQLMQVINENCSPVTKDSFKKKYTVPTKIIGWCSYKFVRLLFKVLIFFEERELRRIVEKH